MSVAKGSGFMMRVYKTVTFPEELYPNNIDPCSSKHIMRDHCSLSLLTLSLLVAHSPWMERQLRISTGRFTFG